MQIISKLALISINETLWIQMLSFLLFLYVMNRVMIRPLRGVIGERRDHIEQIKLDTLAAGREYEELRGQIQSQEDAVRRAASAARLEREAAGSREADRILAEVLAQIDTLRRDAESEVSRQAAAARGQLAAEAQVLTVAIMEKILERRVSP